MFYCDNCGSARDWPIHTFARSVGSCEICDKVTECNDVKSSDLETSSRSLVTVCITVKVEDVYEAQLQQLEVCARGVFKVSEVRCGTYSEDETYYPAKED